MSALVRHFGDLADGETACGICDFCAPAQCIAQQFRTATGPERALLYRVITALRAGDAKSTGKLHTELCPGAGMSRDEFEEVLGAMARAGLVRFSDAVFEKDGKQIPYRRVSLTRAGREADEQTPIDFIMKAATRASAKRKGKKKLAAPGKQPAKGRKPADSQCEKSLREWRLSEARRRQVPAFRIFSDKSLQAIVSQRPRTAHELLAISGIGIATVEKYGPQIYGIVNAYPLRDPVN
jgi:superfamily II DNA helicase RecQ